MATTGGGHVWRETCVAPSGAAMRVADLPLPFAAALLFAGCGGAAPYQPPTLPPPPGPPIVIPAEEPAPSRPAVTEAQAEPPSTTPAAAPPLQPYVAPPPPTPPPPGYTRGEWIHTEDLGWLWVPGESSTVTYDDVPYAYMYTPSYGWTWYVSPWGVGAYYRGGWARHPWHPHGWGGVWVAPPHVVVRIGHEGRHGR